MLSAASTYEHFMYFTTSDENFNYFTHTACLYLTKVLYVHLLQCHFSNHTSLVTLVGALPMLPTSYFSINYKIIMFKYFKIDNEM